MIQYDEAILSFRLPSQRLDAVGTGTMGEPATCCTQDRSLQCTKARYCSVSAESKKAVQTLPHGVSCIDVTNLVYHNI